MRPFEGIILEPISREESNPGFAPDFPHVSLRAEVKTAGENVLPWHWHKTVQLFYVESGSMKYITPAGEWVFPAGSGGMVNAGVLHCSQPLADNAQTTVQLLHLFAPSLLCGEQGSRMELRYVLPLLSQPGLELLPLFPAQPEQAAILSALRQTFALDPQEEGYEFFLRDSLCRLWLDLIKVARQLPAASPAHSSSEQIKAALIYIHEHYAQPLTVADIASAMHTSERVCFRLFQSTLRTTPLLYLRDHRLQKACRLLRETQFPITQIAYSCGFGSSSYFGKLFRSRFSCSPAQYRKTAGS